MAKQVKTTVIEKKTKTGGIIKINYAKVGDRLNEFRADHPRSKIMTVRGTDGNNVVFKAYIWKDKTDFMELLKAGIDRENALLSSDSEGTAEYAKDDEKKYEKLETIAVGRALALLGYSGTGEVASTEEMEEFEDFKRNQQLEAIEAAITQIEGTATIDELKTVWNMLAPKTKVSEEVIKAKDNKKEQLSENA